MDSVVLMLHGWYGNSTENWFPWIQKSLESKGRTVHIPDLPDPIHPKPEDWEAKIESYNDMENGTIVAHSLGAPLAIRYITKAHLSISRLVLIAPTFPDQRKLIDLSPYEGLIDAQERFYANDEDLVGVSQLCERIDIFLSEDDPYIPFDEAWKYYSQIADIRLHHFKDKGHFNADAGILEFPELLRVL